MSVNGVVIPDLLGIAYMKPFNLYQSARFSSKGAHYIYADPCPRNKVLLLSHILIGFVSGNVNYPIIDIVDMKNNRQLLLARLPDLTSGETVNFYGMYWVLPNTRLRVRYNVTSITPTCYLSASGVELVWTGE